MAATLRTAIALPLSVLWILLASPVLLAALGFVAARELITRLATLLEPVSRPWEQMMEYDARIGWRPKARLDAYCVTVRDPEVFHVVTDDEGWPGRLRVDESDLVVFGDSLAFGYAADAERAYWARTDRVSIKAVGAPGYNMVQELLLMREMAPRLRHKLVVWLVYYGNDLFDNLSPEMSSYRTPFVRPAPDGHGWRIETRHVSPEPWPASRGRRRGNHEAILEALHRPGWLSGRTESACEFLLGEARSTCEAVDASLAVVTVPSPGYVKADSVDHVDGSVTRAAAASRVPVVHSSGVLRRKDFRPTDDHWAGSGHEAIARLLEDLYLGDRRSRRPPTKSATWHAASALP